MPVLMYHEGVLNQGVKYPKCKKVYHKVVVIQWICLLKNLQKFLIFGYLQHFRPVESKQMAQSHGVEK